MVEQSVKILSQYNSGIWHTNRVEESDLFFINRKPLIVGLTGGLDKPSYYPGWKSVLSRELDVNVEIPNFYDLPGVKRIGNGKLGQVYEADWQPADRFSQIARAIEMKQP